MITSLYCLSNYGKADENEIEYNNEGTAIV
ncbi:hypothetical protein SAMN04487860_1095 [Ruminococcus flavefaciens]|uniref:Uncharacterized protein n=1 Tax=Ruminococcus flavefaciens TaxID=1265 RepID=A0A1M7KIH1_RUMFL|nr:hypothetical protein SAMN04487860_1095 [Ruminococcus flavefaciens]